MTLTPASHCGAAPCTGHAHTHDHYTAPLPESIPPPPSWCGGVSVCPPPPPRGTDAPRGLTPIDRVSTHTRTGPVPPLRAPRMTTTLPRCLKVSHRHHPGGVSVCPPPPPRGTDAPRGLTPIDRVSTHTRTGPVPPLRAPAPPVRTGTADAERRSGRPRMVCGKGAGVLLGIGSRFRLPVFIDRAAAAEGASRGENRPFGLSRANEWLPMPTAVSPMGNMRSRTVWSYRSASGLGGSRAERRRSRRHGMRDAARAAAAGGRPTRGGEFDRFERMPMSRSQDSDRSRRHVCVFHAYLPF